MSRAASPYTYSGFPAHSGQDVFSDYIRYGPPTSRARCAALLLFDFSLGEDDISAERGAWVLNELCHLARTKHEMPVLVRTAWEHMEERAP